MTPDWLLSILLTATSAFLGAFLGGLAQHAARSIWHRLVRRPIEYIPALTPGQATIVKIGGKHYEAINIDGRIEITPIEWPPKKRD